MSEDRAAFELVLIWAGLLGLVVFGIAVWKVGWVGAALVTGTVLGFLALGWFGTMLWVRWRTR